MSYTKQQLEAMQAAGVPIEVELPSGNWFGDGPWVFSGPADIYRPRPGFTFNAAVARRLVNDCVPVEWNNGDDDEWQPAHGSVCAFNDEWGGGKFTYRIVGSGIADAPAPTAPDEIEELKRERDELRRLHTEACKALNQAVNELDDAKRDIEILINLRDALIKERDQARRERDILQRQFDSAVEQRDKLSNSYARATCGWAQSDTKLRQIREIVS